MLGIAQNSIFTISVVMQADRNPKAQQNAPTVSWLASSQLLYRERRIAGAGKASEAAVEEIPMLLSLVLKKKLPHKSFVLP